MEEIRDFLANTIELKKLLQMYPLLRSEAGRNTFDKLSSFAMRYSRTADGLYVHLDWISL